MWRAFFLAVGIFLVTVGAECLVIDKAVLADRRKQPQTTSLSFTQSAAPKREVVPPPWAPWTLLAAGAVVVLYSFTIPRRVKD